MKCPVCNQEMVTENFGVVVDVCENGCKGIWFDHGNLEKIDQKNEGFGDALEAALRSPRHNDPNRGPIKCPKCSIPMHAHKFKRDQEVNVDECYQCGGFFLDSGELNEIRNNYMSDAEVKAYTDKLASSVPEYSQARQDVEVEEKRLQSIQNLTSLMTLHYWQKIFS